VVGMGHSDGIWPTARVRFIVEKSVFSKLLLADGRSFKGTESQDLFSSMVSRFGSPGLKVFNRALFSKFFEDLFSLG
jgi:hypothetical protein